MRLQNDFYTIETCTPSENAVEYVVRFNADSRIYHAHFPGHPITPGVCIVQIAKELLDCYLNQETELTGVKNAKFLSVIVPEEDKTFTYALRKITNDGTTIKFQVAVTSGDTTYAKMSLTCRQK